MEAKEVIKILKKQGIGVLPTDTIYGLVGLAKSKKVIERIYKVKRRKRDKPFLILLSSVNDLRLFDIKPEKELFSFLKKIWPGKVSIIFPINSKRLFYLHRGKNSLCFRIPDNFLLRRIISKTGPLVAPSANIENMFPAENIKQAKKYFNKKVDFYFNKGTIKKRPSIILEVKRG